MPKSADPNIHYQFNLVLADSQYPIVIGENLLASRDLIAPYLVAKQVCIVSDATVAQHYLAAIKAACADAEVTHVLIPSGEEHKTLATVETIITALLEAQHHRNTTLIALGGGLVGDITGFVASCYLRGVAFLQIPTTLLAQVDASIGGKTAVNHRLGKNLIGTFHQPKLCLIDINTLHTLPHRAYLAGIGEIIKAALLADAVFFTWLEKNCSALLRRQPDCLAEMIYRACQIKAAIVSQDVYEQGPRALLNLGHTFAHAIETALDYQTLLHGEAVALGCLLAAELSVQQQRLSMDDLMRIKTLFIQFGFNLTLPMQCNPQQLVACMQLDKKNQDHFLRLVLLDGIGQAIIVPNINPREIIQFLEKNR